MSILGDAFEERGGADITTSEPFILDNVLHKMGFVYNEASCHWTKPGVKAHRDGRVVAFFSTYNETVLVFAVVNPLAFKAEDLMEEYSIKRGIFSMPKALEMVEKRNEDFRTFFNKYSAAVQDYFAARGVEVEVQAGSEDPYYSTKGFFLRVEHGRGLDKLVKLFDLDVRHDFGVGFSFDNGTYIVVDGENVAENMALVFNEELAEITPEDPVERVNYSSSYHYRHIVNAIADMLEFGVKNVRMSEAKIMSSLDQRVTYCKKHFKPEVLGTITDFNITFNRPLTNKEF